MSVLMLKYLLVCWSSGNLWALSCKLDTENNDNDDNNPNGTVGFKTNNPGTFLVIQWLRLFSPSAGGLGTIPGEGMRSHMLQLRSKILCVQQRLGIAKLKKKKERKIIYMQNCTQCLAYDKQCVLVWINILMYIASVTYYFYPSSKDCTTWRIHNRLHRHLLQSLKMEIFTAIKNQLSCLCKHLHNNHLNTEVANHVTNFCLSLHYALKNQVSKTLSNHYLVWGVLLISPLYT